MLCLTRKLHSRTTIKTQSGETMEIVVLDIDRGKIRLGFVGDKTIEVYRDDVKTIPASMLERPGNERQAAPAGAN
jgi:sRNA-binding carbon storage regulator CsrA